MRLAFLEQPPGERRLYIEQAAIRRNISPVILEKDFWVCWLLGILFESPFAGSLVFKGGTSLSKVFGVIERFSEDIDLSVSPAFLNLPGAGTSRNQANKWMARAEAACGTAVRDQIGPAMEAAAEAVLGKSERSWLEFLTDPGTRSPVLLFHYLRADDRGAQRHRVQGHGFPQGQAGRGSGLRVRSRGHDHGGRRNLPPAGRAEQGSGRGQAQRRLPGTRPRQCARRDGKGHVQTAQVMRPSPIIPKPSLRMARHYPSARPSPFAAPFSRLSTRVTLDRLTPQVAGERRPALELAGIQQRLVVSGRMKRIAPGFRGGLCLRFGVGRRVPSRRGDDGGAM